MVEKTIANIVGELKKHDFIKGKMVDGKQGILIPMTETERQNINTYTHLPIPK